MPAPNTTGNASAAHGWTFIDVSRPRFAPRAAEPWKPRDRCDTGSYRSAGAHVASGMEVAHCRSAAPHCRTHPRARRCCPVSYTHLRAHETPEHLVCRLLLEKKKTTNTNIH